MKFTTKTLACNIEKNLQNYFNKNAYFSKSKNLK